MSGHIPRSSQNPYQYSAYPERPSSRQSNTQVNSMQRPPSRSGAFSTSQMRSALPRLQTSFTSHPSSEQSSGSGGSSDIYFMPRPHALSRPQGNNSIPSPSHPLSAQSASSSGSSEMYITRQPTPSRSNSLYGMPQRSQSRSGHRAPAPELTHVRQLPPDEQERFLSEHDPMRYMHNLNANTSLYRTTERRYVSNGRIQGNPESMARIARHDKLVPNQSSRFYADARVGTAEAYSPAPARASDLGPTLNVMAGSKAHTFAAMYGRQNPNNIVVKMKLGDFLQRGGKVYFDVGSAITRDRDTAPLIVTLPRDESVPVQIVQ